MSATLASHQAAWRADPLPYLAAALLFFAILFGGGGAEGPLQNGFIEAAGAILLCLIAARHFRANPLGAQALIPMWLTVAILLAILIQLVPLPPSLWTDLPGREAAAAVDVTIDGQLGWRPISLDPEATRRAAAALLLPVPVMIIAAASSKRAIVLMLRAAIAAALLSAILGAAQLAMGSPKSLAAYGEPVISAAAGVFANPNHHAALLLAALILSGLLIRLAPPAARIRTPKANLTLNPGWFLPPIFAIVLLAAGSRAGLILLAPALIAALLIATGRRMAWIPILLMLLVLVAIGIPLAAGTGMADFNDLQRMLHDNRLISLPDILYTFQQFWPVGSGLGTFVPVFKANENLDLVSSKYLNHAHNDVLELLIEMGLLGALLLISALAVIGARLWIIRRGRSNAEVMATLAGASILALFFLHSLVDYPLRTDAVAGVAGLALGLLFSRLDADAGSGARKTSSNRSKRGFGGPAYSQGNSAR